MAIDRLAIRHLVALLLGALLLCSVLVTGVASISVTADDLSDVQVDAGLRGP